MSNRLTPLADKVAAADLLHAGGRFVQARRAWETQLQVSQERSDRVTEGIARTMLAGCLLRLRDREGARDQLVVAARIVDPNHLESCGRLRSVRARLAVADGPADVARAELRDYLRWAEDRRQGAAILDACLLLSDGAEPAVRVEWLERGIEQALGLETTGDLGVAYAALGSALVAVGELDRALAAWLQAESWYRQQGRRRDEVAAGWAAGSLACRLEDWPLGRSALEAAIATAEPHGDCEDLVALALADLATVYEAAGDVVEARRLLLRAMALGREQGIPSAWPERWTTVLHHARRLDL